MYCNYNDIRQCLEKKIKRSRIEDIKHILSKIVFKNTKKLFMTTVSHAKPRLVDVLYRFADMNE